MSTSDGQGLYHSVLFLSLELSASQRVKAEKRTQVIAPIVCRYPHFCLHPLSSHRLVISMDTPKTSSLFRHPAVFPTASSYDYRRTTSDADLSLLVQLVFTEDALHSRLNLFR